VATKALAAVSVGPVRDEVDFFPLTVDYRAKTEAAGKIPGGFFKREGRPTTKEILTMRLIDRSIRPLFPDGFRQEVQVMSHVLCYDGEKRADLAAMIASFAAVRISGVPFEATLGAARSDTSAASSSVSRRSRTPRGSRDSISSSPATRTASRWSKRERRSSPRRR
jgi:polyribonucleotide nucleotidyltransferase